MVLRMACVLVTLSAGACTKVPPLPPDGDGGSGGSGAASGGAGGTGGAGAIGGTGGTGASGGTGGSGLTCDDGVIGGQGTTICSDCQNCTTAGPCADALSRCFASSLCVSFQACLEMCEQMGGGNPCQNDCVSTNPEGASISSIATNCIACECPNNCDGVARCEDLLVCDTGTVPPLGDPEPCNACTACAIDVERVCTTSDAACNASSDCDDFINCLFDCTNGGGELEACVTTCSTSHPIGSELYQDATACLCAHCPNDCQGEDSLCNLF